MTPTPVLDEQELGLFVKSEMDDYGLDPYEFRIYARIVRRAGRKEAWESVPNMAKACMMSESRVRLALQVLEAAGLIESQERSGYSTLRRLTPKSKWVHPQRLEAIRAALTRTKSATTPIKSDRSSQTHTPSKSDRGVVSKLTPLPLVKVTDEGTPVEGIPVKVLPPSLQAAEKGGKENLVESQSVSNEQAGLNDAKQNAPTTSYLNQLSQQVADVVQNTLLQLIASWNLNSKSIPVPLGLSEASKLPLPDEPTSEGKAKKIAVIRRSAVRTCSRHSAHAAISPGKAKSSPKRTLTQTLSSLVESPERTQLLQQLSALLPEPETLENLRLNTNLVSALDRHPERIADAFEYFKQALATWKNKPGIGLFISAVNKGMKASLNKPGTGWKEWADEAMRRRLMSYSQSGNGDIMIHFVSGVQRLWSEVRSMSWSEIEKLACDDRLEQNAA